MKSIVYAGHDFKDICSAEVVRRSANPILAEYMAIPGRAGALLVSGYVPPVDVTVRLFMDPGFNPGWRRMAEMRAQLRSWLCWPGGGDLVLPDDSGIVYREALLVDASDWSNLFEAGECELTFTLFNPVGYGLERAEHASSFEVGGTWQTYPTFSLFAQAGSAIEIELTEPGKSLRIETAFAEDDFVVIDCATETVTINGADAREYVTLGSDFFAFEPGIVALECTGFTEYEIRFTERWI